MISGKNYLEIRLILELKFGEDILLTYDFIVTFEHAIVSWNWDASSN